MNRKNLDIYLNDHLAGSVVGIELTESCLENNRKSPLGAFLSVLVEELREDQAVLKNLIARGGAEESGMKKGTAWLAEKASRLKLAGPSYSDLGRMEELELLMLGIRGKLALWAVLEELGPEVAAPGVDFRALRERAGRQIEQVEAYRIKAAHQAFLD